MERKYPPKARYLWVYSSFLLLVAMPGATSRVLAPFVAMPFVTSSCSNPSTHVLPQDWDGSPSDRSRVHRVPPGSVRSQRPTDRTGPDRPQNGPPFERTRRVRNESFAVLLTAPGPCNCSRHLRFASRPRQTTQWVTEVRVHMEVCVCVFTQGNIRWKHQKEQDLQED